MYFCKVFCTSFSMLCAKDIYNDFYTNALLIDINVLSIDLYLKAYKIENEISLIAKNLTYKLKDISNQICNISHILYYNKRTYFSKYCSHVFIDNAFNIIKQ